MIQSTALLFFTKTASVEARGKSFISIKNHHLNHTISSLFIQNTRRVAKNTGFPVFEVNSLHQTGNSFGERLSNAVEYVFDKGFHRVIIVGNDCPQLTVKVVKLAAAKLTVHGTVAGQDGRGGAYLIGVNKGVFCKASFTNLSWNTDSLFINLCEACAAHSSYFALPIFKDINTPADFISIKNDLAALHIIKLFLTSLLASFFRKISLIIPELPRVAHSLFGLRAPPLSF